MINSRLFSPHGCCNKAGLSDIRLTPARSMQIHDNAEAHIRSLQSLGISSDTYGFLLAPVLLAKLPSDMRLIITREVADPSLSMDTLLKNFS